MIIFNIKTKSLKDFKIMEGDKHKTMRSLSGVTLFPVSAGLVLSPWQNTGGLSENE